jgi:GPH family glycoside/pentoside/hexuronide:cation symporter
MKQLSAHQKVAYAAPAFSLALVGIPIYVYIPKFYTDVIGVHVAALGTILLVLRLFDAVTDPVIGLLSDRLRTPFGRRRPLIVLGAALTALAIFMLFNPPQADTRQVTIWFMGLMFALFLFWTIITVPYESLGPELTDDYHERTTLFAIRDGALILGTLLAAAAPTLIRTAWRIPENEQGERDLFLILSLIYGPLILACAGWCVLTFKERSTPPKIRSFSLGSSVAESLKNRPFRILLISYTISAIGSNLPATLILYYVEYVLESSRADLFLLIYFVTGIVCLPFWIAGSKKYEKKAMWLAAMVVNTGAFFCVFFLGPGDELIYGVLVGVSGIGFGATLAIPSAIQADVIDYDELYTGERREGLYVGLWSIAKKLAAAFGVGVGLALLGASGYVPNVSQPGRVILALRILYAFVPCTCSLVALGVAFKYPIDQKCHLAILEQIENRRLGKPVCDPLAVAQK